MRATAPRIVGADSQVPGWDFGDRSVEAIRNAAYTPQSVDVEILASRQRERLATTTVLEGDYVEFADGVTRRVSHVWASGVQTSKGGSWHLLEGGGGSFSGGLQGPVPHETLTDTGALCPARFWFFHRNHYTAHNGVFADANVRVWECTETAPQ